MSVSAQTVPALRRGIRRHFDATRAQNVLQCPERVILLDEIGNAIVELCDGQRSITAISLVLAERYAEDAAQVEADVIGFVQELADKGLVGA
jgi:coenzyme PQQ biosynthesis protein PqqD